MQKKFTILFNLILIGQFLQAQSLPFGDFESGLGTATTAFVSSCGSPLPGRYCIGTSSQVFGTQFTVNGLDVKPCQGNSMMCVDGTNSAPTLIWGQTATGLIVGCTYTLSFCLQTISGTGNPNFIGASVDGVAITSLSNLSTTTAWVSHVGTFVAIATTATVTINQTASPFGNKDYAIDNITLTGQCAPTVCQTICKAGDKDVGQQIIKTTNNEVVISGTIFETGSLDKDMYTVKLTSALALSGATTARRIGDNGTVKNETGFDITQGSDGFIYVAGSVETAPGLNDVLVAKLDPTTFAPIWTYRYGLPSTNEGATVILESDINPTNNKINLIVAGNRSVSGAGFDVFAFKIDADGVYNTTINTVFYTGSTGVDEVVYNGIKTSAAAGEVVLVGERGISGNQDFLTFRILISNLQFASATSFYIGRVNSTSSESTTGIVEIGSTLYLSGLSRYVGNNTGWDAMVVKLPTTFTNASIPTVAVYGKTSPTIIDEVMMDLAVSHDNNLVLAGWKNEGGVTQKDGLIFKVKSSDLSVVWSKSLFATGVYNFGDAFNDVVRMNSNQFAIVGYKGNSSTDEDVFVSLINPDGSGCCYANYTLNKLTPTYISSTSFSKNGGTYTRTSYLKDVIYHCNQSWCASPFASAEADEIPEEEGFSMETSQPISDGLTELQLMPNPNSGKFLLSLSNADEVIRSIAIYDLTGKLIYAVQPNISSNLIEVNNSTTEKGIYFVVVKTDTSMYQSRVVITK